jgi:hypothetical protein
MVAVGGHQTVDFCLLDSSCCRREAKLHHTVRSAKVGLRFPPTMLSAEAYSLENKAVQTMMGIRQKELDYINLRMVAMGTQASLLAGTKVLNCTHVATITNEAPSTFNRIHYRKFCVKFPHWIF